MSSKVQSVASAQGPGLPPRPIIEIAPAETAPKDSQGQPNDYRLVIEEDEASGSFVYRTLDRRTGEVISQFPREQILKLARNVDYEAGKVISTKA